MKKVERCNFFKKNKKLFKRNKRILQLIKINIPNRNQYLLHLAYRKAIKTTNNIFQILLQMTHKLIPRITPKMKHILRLNV